MMMKSVLISNSKQGRQRVPEDLINISSGVVCRVSSASFRSIKTVKQQRGYFKYRKDGSVYYRELCFNFNLIVR